MTYGQLLVVLLSNVFKLEHLMHLLPLLGTFMQTHVYKDVIPWELETYSTK